MSMPRATENFGKALSRLREFAAMPIANDRDRAGIIQAFEFTFEQCWKAFQQIASAQGIVAVSPRQALQAGLQLGLIDAVDEEKWLEMLHDRNMTSHLYQESVAGEIAQRVVGQYLALLDRANDRCS
jgi:nucleotidyltransferase substrate binding protein (TIGR01987 family)